MNKLILIKMPYWLGIFIDAIWAIALIYPALFRVLTGLSDFNPDVHVRLVMGIGASLMTGWTFLLMWAVREPVKRRFVIFLTAVPVVSGMLLLALLGFLAGNTFSLWIIIKTAILIILMIVSYLLAGRLEKEEN